MLRTFLIFFLFLQGPIYAYGQVKQMPDDSNQVKALRERAFSLIGSDHAACRELLDEMVQMSERLGYAPGRAMACDIEGNILRMTGQYNEAVEQHLKALQIYDSCRYAPGSLSTWVNLGTDYCFLKNYERALRLYNRALARLDSGDYNRYITISNNIGSVYSLQGKYAEAITVYERAMPYASTDSSWLSQATLYASMAIAYYELGRKEEAVSHFRQAITFQLRSKNWYHYAGTLSTLSGVYAEQGNYAAAEECLRQAEQAAARVQARSVMANCYRNRANLYSKQGLHGQAYTWLNRYIALNDSLLNESHVSQLAESESRFRAQMKDRALKLARVENALQESRLQQAKLWRYGLLLLLLVLLLLLLLAYRNVRLKKKANRLLSDENAQLQSENILAHYETLKSQINPHFLFNSLNALHTLVKTDTDKASAFIDAFSRLFRNVLELKNHPVIRLSEELKLVDDYVYLQQIRFGSNLLLNKSISGEALRHCIPPFCLQMLIENAIKHNIISDEQALQIDLYTEDENWLVLSNNLQPRQQVMPGTGVGIKNIKARFGFLHHSLPEFKMEDNKYKVRIPLIGSQE